MSEPKMCEETKRDNQQP